MKISDLNKSNKWDECKDCIYLKLYILDSKKTIELGRRYSPDYVCSPFKYNLGNYIESLNNGATILLQAGGGCRYGYYAELQEQILKDLNYEFEFINFIANVHGKCRFMLASIR